MGCCLKKLKRKSTIKPSTSFWDKTQPKGGTQISGKNHIQTSSTENINYFYDFIKTLGKNKNGTTKIATRKSDHQSKPYIVKIMQRHQYEKNTRREIENILKLDHPSICKLYETYIDDQNIYLVMEYCGGGSLSTGSVHQKGEAHVAKIIYNLVAAVIHMHSMNVIHRNLNLKNVLFADKDQNSIKIINLGDSTYFSESEKQASSSITRSLTRGVGSDGFSVSYFLIQAPEVLKSHQYGKECDVWSLGVIAYCLLSGFMPFSSDEEVTKGMVSFSQYGWKEISKSAKVTIGKMLNPFPKSRITLQKLLKEEWFSLMNQNKLGINALQCDLEQLLTADRIKNFGEANQFKQMCIKILVKHANDEDLQKQRKIFDHIDQDKNGYIEKDELRVLLEQEKIFSNPQRKNLMLLLQLLCTNQNQLTIKYSDFLAATLDETYYSQSNIKALFNYLDTDSNGFLDFQDMQDIMAREGYKLKDNEAKKLLKDCTAFLKDGKLFFDEFYSLMISGETKVKESYKQPLSQNKDSQKRRESVQVVTFNLENNQIVTLNEDEDIPKKRRVSIKLESPSHKRNSLTNQLVVTSENKISQFHPDRKSFSQSQQLIITEKVNNKTGVSAKQEAQFNININPERRGSQQLIMPEKRNSIQVQEIIIPEKRGSMFQKQYQVLPIIPDYSKNNSQESTYFVENGSESNRNLITERSQFLLLNQNKPSQVLRSPEFENTLPPEKKRINQISLDIKNDESTERRRKRSQFNEESFQNYIKKQ